MGNVLTLQECIKSANLEGTEFKEYLTEMERTDYKKYQDKIAAFFKEQTVKIEDFVTIKTLGEGGFGEVELCEYKNTVEVALKNIKLDPKNKKLSKFIETELKVMSRLIGNQFPRFYKFFYSDQLKLNAHFVMEPIYGKNFGDLLRTQCFFPEDTVRFYLANIVLGLEKMHKKNIIYKDLKETNIMVGNDGYLRLIDFGLCKILPRGERFLTTGRQDGTIDFLAPETLFQQSYGKAVDIWALGVLAFLIISRRFPYTNDIKKLKNKIMLEPNFGKIFSESSKQFIKELLNLNQYERIKIAQVKVITN